jgi:hypothetical protein
LPTVHLSLSLPPPNLPPPNLPPQVIRMNSPALLI